MWGKEFELGRMLIVVEREVTMDRSSCSELNGTRSKAWRTYPTFQFPLRRLLRSHPQARDLNHGILKIRPICDGGQFVSLHCRSDTIYNTRLPMVIHIDSKLVSLFTHNSVEGDNNQFFRCDSSRMPDRLAWQKGNISPSTSPPPLSISLSFLQTPQRNSSPMQLLTSNSLLLR
jgi:hypothetical protein